MAVRFDAATEEYSATNGLPSSVYTLCCWVRPAVLTGGNKVVYWLTASGDVFTGIEFRDNASRDLQGYDSSTYAFNGLGPLAASAGTWYRCALVINGATATFYRSAAGSALGSASVSDFTTPASPSTWYFGDDPYDEWLDGSLAAVKVWSAALTQAEVEHELAQYAPKRTANLIRFHPFIKAETTDYSGAGNTLSGGTGTSTEDGPPIPWTRQPVRLVLPPAGTGAPSAAPYQISQYGSFH